jgi:hypothetical protein
VVNSSCDWDHWLILCLIVATRWPCTQQFLGKVQLSSPLPHSSNLWHRPFFHGDLQLTWGPTRRPPANGHTTSSRILSSLTIYSSPRGVIKCSQGHQTIMFLPRIKNIVKYPDHTPIFMRAPSTQVYWKDKESMCNMRRVGGKIA